MGHARLHAGRNPHGRDEQGKRDGAACSKRRRPGCWRDLEDTPQGPLWTQDLYGANDRWLGPVHGFAGNVIPLLRGWDWLTPAQQAQVAEFVPRTSRRMRGSRTLEPHGAREASARNRRTMCQHCHGAPGMVTTFADAPFATPEFDGFCSMPAASAGPPDRLPRARTFATARAGTATHS